MLKMWLTGKSQMPHILTEVAVFFFFIFNIKVDEFWNIFILLAF